MEPVAVRIRDCACPGTPHGEEGDIAFLAPTLSLAGGLAAEHDLIEAAGDSEIVRQRWLVTFVRHGALGWNVVDALGHAVPFDVGLLLADYSLAYAVADKAADLYAEAVTRPLTARLSGPSRNGRISGSTSPRRRSMRSPRGSSSPASSAGTPSLVLSP